MLVRPYNLSVPRQIGPERPSHAGTQPNARIVDGRPAFQAGSNRGPFNRLKFSSWVGNRRWEATGRL